MLAAAFRIKRSSTFCLEPPGFGEHRKSMVDALTLGCIPVLFSPAAFARLSISGTQREALVSTFG